VTAVWRGPVRLIRAGRDPDLISGSCSIEGILQMGIGVFPGRAVVITCGVLLDIGLGRGNMSKQAKKTYN
jgi:hypothetical protein